MPVHDWTRVDAGIFHDFHTVWLVGLRVRLGQLLPPEYYVLAEQRRLVFGSGVPSTYKQRVIVVRRVGNDRSVAVVEIVSPENKSSGHSTRAFVTKANEFLEAGLHLLIIDLFPPAPHDSRGLHPTDQGPEVPRGPSGARLRCLATFRAGPDERADVQPVAVGDPLPNMPLFLEPGQHIPVPLEETYMAAFASVPRPWSEILAAPATGGAG